MRMGQLPMDSAAAMTFVNRVARHRLADGQIDGFTDLVEQFSVFGLVDGVQIRADEFHVESFERPVVGEFTGDVQGRLTAHAGEQQGAWALLLKDTTDGVRKKGSM